MKESKWIERQKEIKHKIVLVNLKTFQKYFLLKFEYFMPIMNASHQEVMVCSESVLFICFFNNLFELFLELFGGPPNKSIPFSMYFARSIYYQSVNLTSIYSVKVVQKYFG